MKFDLVYINGDSYACKQNFKTYGDHIADFLKCDIVNCAVPGSANTRIFRTSLRDLIELKSNYSKIFACVSITFLFRTEIWDPWHEFNKWRDTNDGDFMCIQPMMKKDWASNKKEFFNKEVEKYNDFCKQYVNWYDVEAETVKILERIVLFVNWCENNNVDYIIFSPMYQETIDFSAPFVSNFYKEIRQNKKILDIFEFSSLEWCIERNHVPMDNYVSVVNGKTYQVGHLGKSGQEAFAEFLLKNYINN